MGWLRSLLSSPTPDPPEVRAQKLAAIGTPQAIRDIVQLACLHYDRRLNPPEKVQPFAEALREVRNPALVDVLVKLYETGIRTGKRGDDSLIVVWLLMALGDSRFLDTMLDWSQCEERDMHAMMVLGAIGGPRAAAALGATLSNEARSDGTRRWAARGLGRIGGAQSVAVLLEVMRRELRKADRDDMYENLLQVVAEAIVASGDEEAIAAVAEHLKELHWMGEEGRLDRDSIKPYRRLVRVLRGTNSSGATAGLLSVLAVKPRDPPYDWRHHMLPEAIEGLGNIADPASLDQLLALYPDRAFQRHVVRALRHFPDARAEAAVKAHEEREHRCFLCGKTETQALLSSTIGRAGPDSVVAAMVSYVESIEAGSGRCKCRVCGMWACRSCLERAIGPNNGYPCPGCEHSFHRDEVWPGSLKGGATV